MNKTVVSLRNIATSLSLLYAVSDVHQVNCVLPTTDVDVDHEGVVKDSLQSKRPTSVLVVSHDESGQSITYHESAIDVNLDDESANSSHHQLLQQIDESNSPADVTNVRRNLLVFL